MSLLWLIRSHIGPQKWWLLAAVLLQLVGTVAGLQVPALSGRVIDEAVAQGDTDALLHLSGLMGAASLTQIVLTIASMYCGIRVVEGIALNARAGLFQKILQLDTALVTEIGASTLLTRATTDSKAALRLVLFGIRVLISTPIMVVGASILAAREDPGMMWIVLTMTVILTLFIWGAVRYVIPLMVERRKLTDKIARIVREQIIGVRVLRAFTREKFEEARYAETNDVLTGRIYKVDIFFGFFFPLLNLFTWIASIAVMYLGAIRVDAGAIEVGSLTAIVQYISQIMVAIMIASFAIMEIPEAEVSAGRIREIFNFKARVSFPAVGSQQLSAADESGVDSGAQLEFDGVTYRFEDAEIPVLEDISFTVPAGTTTAIVGSTGAGKSTLLNLVLRSFDPVSGEVRIDGRDLADYSRHELSAMTAVVPQKPYLFNGTIASNLRFGAPHASDEELWAALEVAQAADFVRAKNKQLDAPISQGGTNVSGGQRQRLAIARALLARPRIYLFDDSFSALDVATDARLRAALPGWTAGATVLIVAQRIATVLEADQILVLDEGRLVGAGTHSELLTSNTVYQEIVRSQGGVSANG
ncbi:ABC transporter ATP-binding protein [Canibacter zhoujuaniae]|uniref:ABC transporter ATP-binding protein n=1 Tax=Canibacter zhoujuaniae TaxID=2708343 RepID=UPI001FBC0E80|nr:ABC transporter ATP-binding protein [Canibacter zhoujuaniae]